MAARIRTPSRRDYRDDLVSVWNKVNDTCTPVVVAYVSNSSQTKVEFVGGVPSETPPERYGTVPSYIAAYKNGSVSDSDHTALSFLKRFFLNGSTIEE